MMMLQVFFRNCYARAQYHTNCVSGFVLHNALVAFSPSKEVIRSKHVQVTWVSSDCVDDTSE